MRTSGHRANSKVVIINRASRKFMAYLTGEAKDQLQPTMAKESSERPSEGRKASGIGTSESVAARTTSAWKPTASSTPFPLH